MCVCSRRAYDIENMVDNKEKLVENARQSK
jgi:hypothetical protein